MRGLVTGAPIPPAFWWMRYAQLALMMRVPLHDVLGWPEWEITALLTAHTAEQEASAAAQAAHARAQAAGLDRAPGIR